jgi:hypothetical protein
MIFGDPGGNHGEDGEIRIGYAHDSAGFTGVPPEGLFIIENTTISYEHNSFGSLPCFINAIYLKEGDTIQMAGYHSGSNEVITSLECVIFEEDIDPTAGPVTQEYNFNATEGQTDFVVPNRVFTEAKVYTEGIRNKVSDYIISDNGTNTTITFNVAKSEDTWILIEA